MYDYKFSNIYNEYGWDYFSLTMGESILSYFKQNNVIIKNHLDLCCGTGVLCDYFYKKGIDTTGVDISSSMINIANNKNKNINFINDDVLKYKASKTYDLVTLTCDAVNHLINDGDINKLFKNIHNMLNDNGYLIFDVYDSSKIEFNKEIVSNRDNGIKVYYYITSKGNLINTNVLIKQNGNKVYETNVIERLYDIKYITNILKDNGFKILKANDKIMDEEQRFKDKIYMICQK